MATTQRVAIIGSGGAGKSTLAREVGERLSLPIIHLDQHFWNAHWTETPTPEWEERHKSLLERERWVMDGNYGGTMDARIAMADTVIFLDMPRLFCIYRVLKRWLTYRNTTRPDMAPDNPEKLDANFFRCILDYPKTRRPLILERLKRLEGKTVIHLKNPHQVGTFLKSLPAQNLQASAEREVYAEAEYRLLAKRTPLLEQRGVIPFLEKEGGPLWVHKPTASPTGF